MNIYVGNLSSETSEDDLRGAFEAFGEVESVNIVMDRFTSEPRGFGFVEMPSKDEAAKAIEELNGTDLGGRALNVNEARPKKTERRGGGGGGRGGRGGGGRGGFGGGGGGGRGGFGGGGGYGGGGGGGGRGGGGGGSRGGNRGGNRSGNR